MSDTTTAEVNTNSACRVDNDKISELKERLVKEHTAHVVNGTNGNGNHKEESEEMDIKENTTNIGMPNGVTADADNGSNLSIKEKLATISSSLSAAKQQTNGSPPKVTLSNKSAPKVIELDGKLNLPAGMSVTKLGPRYDDEDDSDDEEEEDDDDDLDDDLTPDGYGDDDSSDVIQLDPSTSNSPTPGTSGTQQMQMNLQRQIMAQRRMNNMEDEYEDEDDDDEEDVEEVKDSSSDSDIMEVDAEDNSIDPLSISRSPQFNGEKEKGSAGSVGKTNVVTIDDMKTLKALADSAKANTFQNEKAKTLSGTNLLSGKQNSGVTITPAVRTLPPGLTISQSRTGLPLHSVNSGKLPLPAGISVSPAHATTGNLNSAIPNKIPGQLDDPNLTDDTFVVEAPSFIVPYVYEKPPKESIKDFKLSIEKLKEKEEEEKRAKEEEEKKKMDTLPLDDNDTSKKESKKEDNKEDKDDVKEEKPIEDEKKEKDAENIKKDDEAKEVKHEPAQPPKKKSDIFFDSSLGKFFMDLGMNLVQENVQVDLLNEQQRRARKGKSAAVMHAIMSLKANIEQSKEKNQFFHMELRKCRFCSFRTESQAVLDHHMETPHMKGSNYRCNVCKMETRTAQEVMSHMFVEHGVRARLERAAAMHQCPQCPFEDNQKGKLTRHKVGCDKRFRGERNQEPPHDWEPPAKIPKPAIPPQQRYQHGRNVLPNMQALTPQQQLAQQMAAKAQSGYSALQQQQLQLQQLANAGMRQMPPLQQMGPRGKGSNMAKQSPQALVQQMRQGGFPMGMKNGKPVYMQSSYAQNQALMQALNQGNSRQQAANQAASMLLPNLGNNSSVTIQSIGSRNTNKSSQSPSISITPLPGGRGTSGSGVRGQGTQQQMAMKPGQPGNNQGKGGFVICEICDGYIKDLEQLRNHMQWIHKVKIHPKMIYNRPPLNCQKCQFRFFTDQGLERHLLGSHGLVTASMQDLANKGQDSGRCPVCGKVYQWKLLNHVAKDHLKVLKPAHLSYKCTVCTATFGQYKLFENHVYQAHSGGARKSGGSSGQRAPGHSQTTNPRQPIKVSDEITIIPQKKNTPAGNNLSGKSGSTWSTNLAAAQAAAAAAKKKSESSKPESSKPDPDVIDLDDEEEIDDDEPTKAIQSASDKTSLAPSKSASLPKERDPLENLGNTENGEPIMKKAKTSEIGNSLDDSMEGVEQLEDIDDDGDD